MATHLPSTSRASSQVDSAGPLRRLGRARLPRRRSVPRAPTALLRGPLPALPRPLDAAVEGWWRLPARMRLLGGMAVLGLVVFGIVQRTTTTAWGPIEQVVVATTDAVAGSPVSAEFAARPRGLVPADAVATPPDGMLARDIGVGEVVTSRHLATGIDALLEPGEVALAIPDDLPPLPAHAGLEILATALDGTAGRLGPARVLTTDQDWLWIAVSDRIAADVAAAMARGGIALALAPP